MIEQVLGRCAKDMQRGAVFADPDGRLNGWLFFLEGEVRDSANQVAGRRLFAVYQDIDGNFSLISPSILWDLKPERPPKLPGDNPNTEEAITFATEALEAYRKELLHERDRQATIMRKYGLHSLDQTIQQANRKLNDYETRRTKGEKIPEAEVRNELRRKEELERRKQELKEAVRRYCSLLPNPPKVLGVARVFPQSPLDEAMHSNAQIEDIGMKVAMEYERKNGRTPEDVSAHNLGYDIRSTSPKEVRYIEVKARATTGPIILTPNEWLMAKRLGKEYWLYIVEHAATQPNLHLIQDPATKLRPEEQAEIVRYVVRNWQQASHEGEPI